MKRNNFKISLLFITAIILTLGLSISFQSLLAAWTAPLANPATCLTGNPGCDGPINIGSFQQTKAGPLRVNVDNLAATGFVAYGNVGIGTASPGYKLDVQGVFRASGIVYTGSSFRYIGSGNTIMDSNQFYCNNGSNCHFNYSGTGQTHIGNSAGTYIHGTAYANGYALCQSNGTNCPASGLGGSGTLNYVAKWTGAGSLGNSSIFDNGNVGIGTTGPGHKLDVNGNIGLAVSSYINFGATDGTSGYGFRDNGGNIQYKNSGGAWTNISDTVVRFSALRVYVTSTTWTKPTGFAYATVRVFGGGGGGGGAGGSSGWNNPGAGGGGGGYTTKTFVSSDLSSSQSATVGAGGAGGAGNSTFGIPGAVGGTSSFKSISSTGGGGGGGARGVGGAGGVGSGGEANQNLRGINGGVSVVPGGAGGAAAGVIFGGGAGGTAYGAAGNAYAGGGAGGNTPGGYGGAGAAGAVIIYEYTTVTSGTDLAENFPTADETLSPGEIVSFDSENPTFMKRAAEEDTLPLAGIISTQPGLLLYDNDNKGATGQRPVALSGRVPVKVNLENGPIAIGDRIALSSEPGVGRKANAFDASVGIAIEPYTPVSTTDRILVFINLQPGLDMTNFVIDKTTGNVGIGTTNPQAKLHVGGTAGIDGIMFPDGTLQTTATALPPKAISAFFLSSCPTGWILADGANGTPDLRGAFVRGMYGDQNGRDVARPLGNYQEDNFKSHTHTELHAVSGQTFTSSDNWADTRSGEATTNTGATGGTETRPKNVVLIYCMKQ
ncbi:MAG: hypothetical protein ABIB72_03545 [Candidatus Falkowbacteria bacterium]